MLKNYFRIAWRNLSKNKVFTLLNLGGLTISLAACLIVFLWASDELNYDTASQNADRVFRAALTLEAQDQPDKQFAVTAPPLAHVLMKDFPEIEKAVRITLSSVLVGYKNEHFFTDKFLYADESFFDVFGYMLIKGNAHTALNEPNSAVITESMAKKLFGDVHNAIGKTITSNDTSLLNITGVAKDLPISNHFHFDIISSVKLLDPQALEGWWNDNYYTYVLVRDAKSVPALDKKISTIMDKYNSEQNKAIGLRGLHFLQPVKSIHLHSDLGEELEPNGSIASLRIFIGIAIFLLIVACINYINLTTATSFRRAKEIGMRKVAGAALSQLVAQFLSESILIALTAFLFSIGLTQVCLPLFNNIAGTQISLAEHLSFPIVSLLIAFAVLLGVIAGLYPALYLSKIRPIKALKKISDTKSGSLSLRKALVVFQFSLSIVLIIATIVALQQLHYMQSHDLGFNKEQVLAITLRNQAESNAKEIIKKEFEKNSGISLTTSSSSTPGKGLNNITVLPEGVAQDHIQTMNTLVVDYNFILIAGINYVNLATAKAAVRTKEVGIRKVTGASRSSLISQFLTESVITSLAACLLAVVIAQLLLPAVNTITQKQLTFINNPSILGYLFVLALSLGIAAGIFPAIYLSSFKPVVVLKGLIVNSRGTLSLRKVLVVVQFTISIVLIVGALIITQQVHFMQSETLGLNKDQVVIVKNIRETLSDADKDAFQNAVLQINGVKKIAMSEGVLGGLNGYLFLHEQGSQNLQHVDFLSISDDYLDALGIRLKEGRSFSAKFPTDITNNPRDNQSNKMIGSVILNETAVKELGIKEPAVGKNIFWGQNYLRVVGVVKNFHFTSFHNKIKPFAFVDNPRRMGNFTIKLSTDNMKVILAELQNAWNKFSPERPFKYFFLDETYAKLYQSEIHFQQIFTSLVILGILIACLGLFGLATFAAQQRVKEIGIRKVLGASVNEIVRLLSKDFLKLVFIALIIATPIAWFFMNKWLQDFAYRINISWWIFLVAGFVAILIAVVTVSFQAIKAAVANPVKSLRTE